jgi:hypothetical protein
MNKNPAATTCGAGGKENQELKKNNNPEILDGEEYLKKILTRHKRLFRYLNWLL